MSEATTRRFPWREVWTTVGAFILALIIGAILMIVTDAEVRATWTYLFARPSDALTATWTKVAGTYTAMITGSVGSWSALAATTYHAAPLIFAGLGVALAFRAGLFNIGAQGQATVGAILGAYFGFAFQLPPVLHLLVVLLMGIFAGAVWGGIVGFLKARTGAHEVIVTIMLNSVASILLAFLLRQTAFQRPGRSDAQSPMVHDTAALPFVPGSQLHLGFLLAVLAAIFCWWLLERSTTGFAIRAVGANPHAATVAGMSAGRTTVITMAVAGGLAGMAGLMTVLGPDPAGNPIPLSSSFLGSVGFDAITVALLGRSRPIGVIFAGLLFGALHAGGQAMQAYQTPATLATVLQALIVLFVAAPALVATLLPFLKARKAKPADLTTPNTGALS